MDPQRPNTTSTNITEDFPSAPDDYFIKDIQFTLDSPAVSSQYLPTSGLIVFGCEDGTTRIFSPTKKAVQYSLVKEDKSPVMGIAGTPASSTIKNTIMVVHYGGTLQYWHGTSNQLLFQKKYEASLQSCQISLNSQYYVVSGQNGDMMLGHLDKGNPTMLETGHLGSHANRVFCIKWHNTDNNKFFSGGWDKAVFMWDIRTKTSVKSLYGYFMGGQAIDVRGNQVLLGNNQNESQLRIYDMKAQKVRGIHWQHFTSASKHSITGVHTCFFGYIWMISIENKMVIFQRYQVLTRQDLLELINVYHYFHTLVDVKGFSMCSSESDKSVVTTWSNGDVKIMAY